MIPGYMVDSVGKWDEEMQQEVLRLLISEEAMKVEWRNIAKDNLAVIPKMREDIALRDAKIKQLESIILGVKQ